MFAKKISILFLLMLFALVSAHAQLPDAGEKAHLPPGPLVVNAPKFSKWTVTITETAKSKEGATNAAGPVAKITKQVTSVIKTEPIRKVEIKMQGGAAVTIWSLENLQLHTGSGHREPTIYSPSSRGFADFSKGDFPEVQWVSEKNFVTIKKVGERDYLVFREKTSSLSKEEIAQARAAAAGAASKLNEESFSRISEAYIDAETRLPVSMRQGTEVHVYRFDEPPTSLLTLPADLKRMADAEQARLKQLAAKPPAG